MALKQESKKSRSFDLNRSFSFAEISRGSHKGKEFLCSYVYSVRSALHLYEPRSNVSTEQILGSQREDKLLLVLLRNSCTVREDPAYHTSNALGLYYSLAAQDRLSAPLASPRVACICVQRNVMVEVDRKAKG